MTLTRTHENGAVFIDGSITSKSHARRRVAWCGTDNLGMTRSSAAAAADAYPADLDEPYVLGPFTFVLTRESA